MYLWLFKGFTINIHDVFHVQRDDTCIILRRSTIKGSAKLVVLVKTLNNFMRIRRMGVQGLCSTIYSSKY